MAQTLPPEIWLRIGHLIPSSVLQNLYSVNSLFLDLALNERYRDLSLATCWTATSTKRLKHLTRPHIAHRVKRLTLPTDWFQANLFISLQDVRKLTMRMAIALSLPFDLGRFIDRTAWIMSHLKKYNKLIARVVANFRNISSLVIVEVHEPFAQSQTDPIVLNAYTACASNLKTLSLVIKSDKFNAFPPNASELTSVEKVDLRFSPPFGCSANPEAASTFLLAIASGLTTLDISFCDTRLDEISKLWQSFPRGKAAFPKLTTFSLSHSGPPAAPSSSLTQFLNQHANTLKHLRLQLTPQSFDDLGLPLYPVLLHIETLNLLSLSSCWSFNKIFLPSNEGLDAARAYAQHSWSTLTSLNLSHCSFTLRDLGILLDLHARGSGGLKNLTVLVQVLSPQALDILAEKLPRLEKLMVGCGFLRSRDFLMNELGCNEGNLTPGDIEAFLLEMKTRFYSDWSLRSFGINYLTGVGPDLLKELLVRLALCIPHLVEIDGPLLLSKMRGLGGQWTTKYDELL